ncbi:MAG TPA: lytic enzyme [Thermoanaerobaculia bacterium]|nr:lytic enzyme [Thermoanaerobaculia bacterium]
MAQALHETGSLTILVEDMNYRAERIVQVWPTRFATAAAAAPFAHNPEGLANSVYGGRMGNNQPGDGYRFIGRGLLQITGRDSYTRYGRVLKIDLAGNPAHAIDPAWTIQIAAAEWTASNCNVLADADSLQRLTRAINGGLVGLSSRQDRLVKTKHCWH